MHHEQMIAMKTGTNPPHRPPTGDGGQTEQEDPYGRCTNMRLTSFTDKGTAGVPGTGGPRDPRLIDLSQSSAVSTGNLGNVPTSGQNLSNGGGGGNWGGPPLPQSQSHNVSNFNTLPAHMTQQHQV